MPISRVGWISIPRVWGVACILLFPYLSFSAYQIVPPFWAAKIDSGLYQRDAFLKQVLPDTTNFSLILLNPIQRQLLCDRIAARPDTLSPWYHFVVGIIECDRKKDASSTHFAAALASAKQDPGTTWALFVEFSRNRQTVWAERCLMHLEKLFLASGASRAPVIAQQLMYYGHQQEKEKNLSAAFSYYAWAERFDPEQLWSGLHRLRHCLPSHPQLFFSTLSSLYEILSRSWQVQLALVAGLTDMVRFSLWVLMIGIICGLGAKYAQRAVHPIVDKMPESAPGSVRTMIAVAVLASLFSFGIYPFLWFVAFCVWRFLEGREKVLMTLAVLLLAGAPLASRIHDMFLQARALQSSLTVYARATREGYQSELHQLALKKIIIDPADVHAHCAAALFASRMGDTAAARMSIRKAMELRPQHRVILTLAGNIEYLAGDRTAAVSRYQQVLTAFPDDMVARFNLSQCYARNADTTPDLDFMKLLSKRDQATINDFISQNNVYFSRTWPPLRQIMTPDYRTREFWFSEFAKASGSWNTTRSLWGASFLGMDPKLSLIVSISLFLALIAWGLIPIGTKPRAATACRLCGRTICKECARGELCFTCAQRTQFIRNVKTLAAIQNKIVRRRQILTGLLEHVLDCVLPGSGMLYRGNTHPLTALLVLLCTAIVYAGFIFLSNMHLAYPHWAAYGIMEVLPYFLFLYNALFLARAILTLFRKKEKVIV